MTATIEAQREQLMELGYVIVPDMIPPDELQRLRNSVDRIVQRATDAGVESRVITTEWVEPETADAVEFLFDERTLGFSRELMNVPAVIPSGMWVLIASGTGWHRDIHPIDMAPLDGLQEDIRLNGPPYLQWHIALYDDSFLHIVSGSHLRRNNDEERKIERRMGVVPLPGAMPVDLKAGDGVVYINCFLHSAAPNGETKRRTFHGGYHAVGNKGFGHMIPDPIGVDFVGHLSSESAAKCKQFDQLHAQHLDEIAATFRAMIERDRGAFVKAFETLHPSEHARMTSLIVLSKIAAMVRKYKDSDSDDWQYTRAVKDLGARFTAADLDQLWDRFGTLEEELTADTEQYESLFQNAAMKYHFYEMPENFSVEDFITSWESAGPPVPT
jgi:hypothetical protein